MSSAAPEPGNGAPRLDWRQVRVLYLREIRAALREKTIVLNSILIPVFLYPFLLWVTLSGLMFIMGQTEGFQSRIGVRHWPEGHPALRHKLEHTEHLAFEEAPANAAEAEARVKSGRLDAIVDFLPAEGNGINLQANFRALITFDGSKEVSNEARARVADVVDQYRHDWLKRAARFRGIDAAGWQGFTLTARNVATKKEMGGFLLGLIAPVIFVVMVAMGCFYPAVDTLAGERERQTWETLMSSAPSRLTVLTAKYLHVATFGGAAGLMNLVAILVTMRPIFGPLFEKTGKTIEWTVPLGALPVIALSGVLLAGFIAAAMMIFAVFARTFKEGQAMITPFYMLTIVPVVFLQAPGIKLSVPLALVPIVNVTLMVREALAGKFHWLPMVVTVAASLLLILVCLRVATFILRFEDVVMGSYTGSFNKFFRQRMLRSRVRTDTSNAL